MVYISQILGKTVYFDNKPFGKIVDMAVTPNSPQPSVSKLEIKREGKKLTISPGVISFLNNKFLLQTNKIPLLPYDHNEFYLAEDLLDKQVIDVNGRRIVRVNDIVLEINGEIKIVGIDVGFNGILRRLGLWTFKNFIKIIPWNVIEAFDYQTGNIKIKLTQRKLSLLHPSEIADILEDVGSKERMGIVAALDAKKAARAIEKTNSETQISILEDLPVNRYKDVFNKIHSSNLADIFQNFRTNKSKEIENVLNADKIKNVKKLLLFSNNTAGGLMHLSFFCVDAEKTVKEVIDIIQKKQKSPEAIIVTNSNGKFIGTVKTKNLLFLDKISQMKDVIEERLFVFPEINAQEIVLIFSKYNLRILCVTNKEKQPIGVILIDDILSFIEEEKENENI